MTSNVAFATTTTVPIAINTTSRCYKLICLPNTVHIPSITFHSFLQSPPCIHSFNTHSLIQSPLIPSFLHFFLSPFLHSLTFSSVSSLQSISPSHNQASSRHSWLWGQRWLVEQGGGWAQCSSSERSLQSRCPSHRTATDTHWPLEQRNSELLQLTAAEGMEQ